MTDPGKKKMNRNEESVPEKNDNSKSDSSNKVVPHYDTQVRNPEVNTDVEIAKGTIGDSFETDSKPRGT